MYLRYPSLPKYLSKEDLIEHFTIRPSEGKVLARLRENKNVVGFTVLLKAFQFLGYPPYKKVDVSNDIVGWIAGQLKLDPIFFRRYQWKGQTFKHHLPIIRKHTGFRPCEHDDHSMIIEWLTQHGSKFSTRKEWREATISRFREVKIELPVEKNFRRLVNPAQFRRKIPHSWLT